jgi:hypothetical protein
MVANVNDSQLSSSSQYGTSDEAFVDDETGVYYENTMSYFLSKILDEQPMYNPLVVEFALTPFKLSSYFSWHPGPDEISILPTMPPMELTQISTQSPSGGGTAALVESRVQAEFRTPYNNLPFGFTVWDASEALILSNVSLLTTETSVIPGDCSCEFEPVSLRINLETTAILRFVCNCSCFPTGGGTTCESLPLTEADLFVASDATDATGCTALVSALCDTDTETWYTDTGAEILTGSCMNATQTDQVFVAPCTVDTDVQLESALPAVRYINAAAEVDRHGYQIVAGVHDFRVPLILYTN